MLGLAYDNLVGATNFFCLYDGKDVAAGVRGCLDLAHDNLFGKSTFQRMYDGSDGIKGCRTGAR